MPIRGTVHHGTRRSAQVSGIEGTYRMTCESVMRVLRENKGSLMAMLEASPGADVASSPSVRAVPVRCGRFQFQCAQAFAHDPIINWRLLTDAPATTESKPKPAAATRAPIGGAALLQPQPDVAAAGTAALREISREKKDFGKSDVDEAPEEILNERVRPAPPCMALAFVV